MEERLTVDQLITEVLPQLIEEKPNVVKKINAVITVQLTGNEDMTWTIDCKDKPGIRPGQADNVKCHMVADKQVLEDLINKRKIKPWLDAYKTRTIEVKGSLPTIIRLERLVSKLVEN